MTVSANDLDPTPTKTCFTKKQTGITEMLGQSWHGSDGLTFLVVVMLR